MSAEERSAGRARGLAAIAVLFVLPLALRLWPIEHGMPRNYVPDTHVVRSALGMARDKNPVPEVGRYSSYPNLLPYALLPVYAAQYAAGRATGAWSGSGEFGNAVLEHPELVHLPARILLAILCALTPWVVFRAARAAGLGSGAWVSAWLVATGLLHTHFSVQERPWGPMVFFLALSVWPAVLYVKEGRAKHLYLAGLAAALALATHQAGAFTLGVAGFAWLIGPPGPERKEWGKRVRQGFLCVLGFALVALLVGHPYYLRYGSDPGVVDAEEQMNEEDGTFFVLGGQAFKVAFRWASVTRLSAAIFGYDPALVILGLLGLWGALQLRTLRVPTLFALLWAAIFLTNRNDHVRYLLPLVVLLPLPAGLAAEMLLRHGWGRVVLVPLLCLPLVQDMRLGWVLRQPDTRALAEARLAELPAGARVAVDRYGPLVPMDRASLERTDAWRDLGSREEHRLLLLAAGLEPDDGLGLDVVRVEDLFLFDERRGTYEVRELEGLSGADAHAVFAEVGVTHLLLVDRRPGDGVPPLLLHEPEPGSGGAPALREVGAPLWTVDPGSAEDGSVTREALLPTEMDFPLTSLWAVSRPGPRLELRPLH